MSLCVSGTKRASEQQRRERGSSPEANSKLRAECWKKGMSNGNFAPFMSITRWQKSTQVDRHAHRQRPEKKSKLGKKMGACGDWVTNQLISRGGMNSHLQSKRGTLARSHAQTHTPTYEEAEVASRVLEKVRSAELEIESPPFTVNLGAARI